MPEEEKLEWHVSDGIDLEVEGLPEGYSVDDIEFKG